MKTTDGKDKLIQSLLRMVTGATDGQQQSNSNYTTSITGSVLILAHQMQAVALLKGDKTALKKDFISDAIRLIVEHRPSISGMVPK